MRKGSLVFAIAVAAGFVFGPSLMARAQMMPAGKDVTVTGEVIDTACYLMGGKKGAAHAECAKACAKAGQDLGLLADDGKVYFLAGEKPGVDPNIPLKDHIAKRVEVKGMLFDKFGADGLVVKEAKEL